MSTPEDIGLFLDRLRDASTEAWALVDDLAQTRHDVDDHGQRVELRAAQDHVSQAWAQLQHATTRLTALSALLAPAAGTEPPARPVRHPGSGGDQAEWFAVGHAMSCPLTCDGCWCSHGGACWHHR